MKVNDKIEIDNKIFIIKEIQNEEFKSKKLNKTTVILEELKSV